jgi:hypothetical protein
MLEFAIRASLRCQKQTLHDCPGRIAHQVCGASLGARDVGNTMYQLTITQEPGYLHAVVSGTNTSDAVARYLDELRRECIARQCFRLLIEERLEGPRLGTFPVYKVVSEGSERARGVIEAIAYVDLNAQGALMGFAETVAVNRGLTMAVFRSVEAARAWLMRKAAAAAPVPDNLKSPDR